MSVSGPVLVVEDDRDVRESLVAVLEDAGYKVISASDGRAALALLRAGPLPSVILLDLMMPVMDGWRFLEVVAGEPDLASIPVVISTSAPDRAPTGPRVLAKPVDLEDFMAELRTLCGNPTGPLA